MSKSFHVSDVSRGQAYAMLGGAALMMTLAMGIRQNMGLFQAPAAKELGIAVSDFALAISVQQVAWGLSQPFAGILADRHGTRWVALSGSVLFIVGLWLTATAQGALPIVIGAGVLIGILGAIELESLVEISLGIASADFKRMAASYVGRWDLVQLRCANFMSCTLEERLALILLELSENFGVPDGKGIRLTLPARHSDLAELVGASRPRITEHLISFERKNLISRNGRQLVVNRDRLESFLGPTHISENSAGTVV